MAKQMMCPKYCGVALEQIKVGGMKVDQCPACEGVWFDSRGDELFSVLRLGRGEMPEQLLRSWKRDKKRSAQDRPKRYNCPRCGLELTSRWFGTKEMEGQTFVIDTCRGGCGAWLDDGELAIAREFIGELAPGMLAEVKREEGLLQALVSLFKR